MSQVQRRLITYCTNIHPAQSWDETFAALAANVPRIRDAVACEAPFPIGLRLSAQAAQELAAGRERDFAAWLEASNCFVPTVNGFPYEAFYGAGVKEKVYLPDWRSGERAEYTKLLGTLLAGWLPRGRVGSISTVPVCLGQRLDLYELMLARRNLMEALQHLERLWQERGADLVLALEPEPGCYLETAGDLARFLDRMNFPRALQRRVGICLDCCHQALQFEEAAEVVSLLSGAGIRIAKVQVSSALRVRHDRRQALFRFHEPCYLHQVVIRRRDGSLVRYLDLPDALNRHAGDAEDEWRCHFHIPLFIYGTSEFQTTRFFAEQVVSLLDPEILLETETYTWQALAPELRGSVVSDAVIKEMLWLKEKVNETDGRY